MRAALLAAVAAGLLLTGCGGGTTNPQTAQTDGGSMRARAVVPAATPAASGPAAKRSQAPKVESGNRPAQPAANSDADAEQPESSTSPAANPCSLVSRSQASAIVGRTVSAPTLAPQGPTCIYGAGKQSVTLAVDNQPIELLRKRNPGSVKVQVAGRTGYCVTSPQLTLLIPMDSGQTLTIGAACPIAARFATEALS